MLLLTGAAKLDIYTAAGTTKAINLTTNIGSMMIYLLNGKVIFYSVLRQEYLTWQEIS